MNAMRILVLVIALGAAGMAALLLGGFFGKKQAVASPGPNSEMTEVLVAAGDIDVGHRLTGEDLRWQKWPKDGVSANFITKDGNPGGLEAMVGSIARTVLFTGEPATEGKLVRAESASFMAATLSPGMRAVSVELTEQTGAGGFILPNDRVDVIVSGTTRNNETEGTGGTFTRTLLQNIRVLAVGQSFRNNAAPETETAGETTEAAKTATLEVSPLEAEILEQGAKAGTLSLALRGLAEADTPIVEVRVPAGATGRRRPNTTITIIKFGEATQMQPATIQ